MALVDMARVNGLPLPTILLMTLEIPGCAIHIGKCSIKGVLHWEISLYNW